MPWRNDLVGLSSLANASGTFYMAVVGYCALQTNISCGIEEIFFNSAHFFIKSGLIR